MTIDDEALERFCRETDVAAWREDREAIIIPSLWQT